MTSTIRNLFEKFSLADLLSETIPEEWENWKDTGNSKLKEGDKEGAVSAYTSALSIAQSPTPQLRCFACIATRIIPHDTVVHAVLSVMDLMDLIADFLHREQPWQESCVLPEETLILRRPNKPAAVCLANRAAVYLQMKRYPDALVDALAACESCPEYVKGHYRVVQAYKGLKQSTDAKRVQEEISDYELCVASGGMAKLPWYGPALLIAGWVDHFTFMLIYNRTRIEFAGKMLKNAGSSFVAHKASLVPFQGGQWLMLGVDVFDEGERVCLDCLEFVATDFENDADLERPPNGHASKASLEHTPPVVCKFITRLEKYTDVPATSLMLGQGLVDHIEMMTTYLKEKGFNLFVHPSLMTNAMEMHLGISPLTGKLKK